MLPVTGHCGHAVLQCSSYHSQTSGLDAHEVAPSRVPCRHHPPDVALCVVQSRNFKAGMELMVRIGAVAEEEGHHPDLHLESWNKVYAVLSTHSIGTFVHISTPPCSTLPTGEDLDGSCKPAASKAPCTRS